MIDKQLLDPKTGEDAYKAAFIHAMAGKALNGLCSKPNALGRYTVSGMVKDSYLLAHEMWNKKAMMFDPHSFGDEIDHFGVMDNLSFAAADAGRLVQAYIDELTHQIEATKNPHQSGGKAATVEVLTRLKADILKGYQVGGKGGA